MSLKSAYNVSLFFIKRGIGEKSVILKLNLQNTNKYRTQKTARI